MNESAPTAHLVSLSAEIVSAYVKSNSLPVGELTALIKSVHTALARLGEQPAQPAAEPLTPAVPVKKSITQDYLVCLEDGKKFKSLKRHLSSAYGMTPEQYRAKWNLPRDYPMVAPAYARARSELAKTMGLGQKRKKAAAPAPARKARRKAA